MNEMQNFLDALGKAFDYANKIEGIDKVHWSITYSGTIESRSVLQKGIEEKMKEACMKEINSK